MNHSFIKKTCRNWLIKISITAAIDLIDWVLSPPIFTETDMIDKTGILINLF